MIDRILIEDSLLNAQTGGKLSEARAFLSELYDKIDSNGVDEFDPVHGAGYSPFNETAQTEDGYFGLEKPLG